MWVIFDDYEMREYLINLDAEMLAIMTNESDPILLIGAMYDLWWNGYSVQAIVIAETIDTNYSPPHVLAWLSGFGAILRQQYRVSWDQVRRFFEYCYGILGYLPEELYGRAFEIARQMREESGLN